eukprot:4558750-Amphidinium_carterae.1
MEIIESAIRSLADDYINHSAGIEGNDSNDWCSFSLQVSTRVLTRESGPVAMNLDNIDNFDDNHTTQPDQVFEREMQSVSFNHGLTMTLRPFSMLAADQVNARVTSCTIAAGVPEWSSDTCCPSRPSWQYWDPPLESCVIAVPSPPSTCVCDVGQDFGANQCPNQTQMCIPPPTCSECDCVTPPSPHACPHVTPSPEMRHDTCVHVSDWCVPSCTFDSCMCNAGVQPSLGDDPHIGYPQWNYARVTQCPPHSLWWPIGQCPCSKAGYVANPLIGDSIVMLGDYFNVGFTTSEAQCWCVHDPPLRCHCMRSLTMDVLVSFPCCCCGVTPQVHLDCPTPPSMHDVPHAISEQDWSPPLNTATSAVSMDDDQGEKKKSHEEWSPPDFSMRDDDMPDFDGDTEVKEDNAEKPDDKKDAPVEVLAAAKAADDAEEKTNPTPEAKAEASVKPEPEHPEDKAATEQAPTHVHEASAETPESLASVEPPESLATKPDTEADGEKTPKKSELYIKFPYDDHDDEVDYPAWTVLHQMRPYRYLICVPAVEIATLECDHAWPLVPRDPPPSLVDATNETCDLVCAWYLAWSGMCYISWMWTTFGHMCMKGCWSTVYDGGIRMPPTVHCPLCVCLTILAPIVCRYIFQWMFIGGL